MDINEEFTDKLDKLILQWKSYGVKINPGISSENLEKLKDYYQFSFEHEFLYYLTKMDGFVDFDSDEPWFSFWSQKRMAEENADGSHPEDVIWFSDHGINLCSFGFHKIDRKVYRHYQTIDGLECVADSFSDFIDTYLKDPYLFYHRQIAPRKAPHNLRSWQTVT